jgi:hypothetical protein
VVPAMLKLDALFEKHKPTAYIFGHVHNLQYAESNYTMYVQSGAGAEVESNENYCPKSEKLLYPVWEFTTQTGFVHALLDGDNNTAKFQFIATNGSVVHTAFSKPNKKRASPDDNKTSETIALNRTASIKRIKKKCKQHGYLSNQAYIKAKQVQLNVTDVSTVLSKPMKRKCKHLRYRKNI